MSRILRSNKKWVNQVPGSINVVEMSEAPDCKVQFFFYNQDELEECGDATIDSVLEKSSPDRVLWINVNTISNSEILTKIRDYFNVHPLTIEDITHPRQRSKCENMDHYLYIVTKMISYDDSAAMIKVEQISILLFENCVITFQERPGDVFESLRERLRNSKGRIRKFRADYLVYSLLDAVIDHYFLVIEKISDKIEVIEESLLNSHSDENIQTIHLMKREILLLRKFTWPSREMVNFLVKDESNFISDECRPYIHDLYDHIIQILDTVETLRDLLSGLLDMCLTQIGNRMNEVMKVLTVMASIFIPLTFIAGIYGMNFEYMPELKHKWGYPAAILFMLLIATGMLTFFKKKKWF